MGQCEYSVESEGMTEKDALNRAIAEARDYYGYQDGYTGSIASHRTMNSKCIRQPKPAKRCKTERYKSGPRKWKTVYLLQPHGYHTDTMTSMAMTKEFEGTVANAVKEAKRLAIKYGVLYSITIQKKLASGKELVAEVSPNKPVLGKWRFWGWAAE
jgi:hypothetical protein